MSVQPLTSKQLCVPAVHSLICVHALALDWYPLGQVHAPRTRCGVGAGQLVHALDPAPLQVVQLAWHAAHDEPLLA